jgi:methylamine utilization protein MauE
MPLIDPAVEYALRGAAALLFASAAWHKARDPIAFWQVLAAYRLLPEPLVRPVSRVIPIVEGATALALLSLYESSLPIVAAVCLWLAYGAAMSINLVRGRTQMECGCGGVAGDQRISWALVIRNCLLASCISSLLLPGATRAMLWLDFTTAFFGGVVLILLYAAADHLIRNAALLVDEGTTP